MKRANIIIKGNVQMGGFQTFIKNMADSFNVKGFAENIADGSVRVVCEGEEGGITGLVKTIKQNPPSFARIDDVSVEYEDYKGEFIDFERRGSDIPREDKEDAMLRYMQSFDKKGEVMIDILGSMNETLKSVKEDTGNMLVKQDIMREKQDTMIEKQDNTIEAIRNVSEKIDQGKEGIVTEIRSLREDLKSYMANKFAKIEHEITEIKAKIGMI